MRPPKISDEAVARMRHLRTTTDVTVPELARMFCLATGSVDRLLFTNTRKTGGEPLARGSRRYRSRLTDADAVAMRLLRQEGYSTIDLAKLFDVTQAMASIIVRGKGHAAAGGPVDSVRQRCSNKLADTTADEIRAVYKQAQAGAPLDYIASNSRFSAEQVRLFATRRPAC
jgi:hypothetical protein